jgi:hypothetical protein
VTEDDFIALVKRGGGMSPATAMAGVAVCEHAAERYDLQAASLPDIRSAHASELLALANSFRDTADDLRMGLAKRGLRVPKLVKGPRR